MRPAGGAATGRLWVRVAGFLVVLAIGVLIGRATAPAGAVEEVAEPGPAGPPRIVRDAGVPVSFAETREGAAEAAAAYQKAFAEPSILRPGVLAARVRAIAAPDYAKTMLGANGPGIEAIAAGPIGAGLSKDLRTVYTAVPIGYKVERFSGGRAQVETWGLTLLGNAGTVEPAAWFGTSHTELVWSGDRWRIASTGAAFGPTPSLATKPGPLGAYDVLDELEGLRGYELAP